MKTETHTTETPNHTHELKGVKYQSVLSPAERIIALLENMEKRKVEMNTDNFYGEGYKDGYIHAINTAKIWFNAEIKANEQLLKTPKNDH